MKKSRLKHIGLLFLMLGYVYNVHAQKHPRILVNPSDKQKILNKIKNVAWADSIYTEYKLTLEPYVNRHQNNPEWILSRYLMNWKEGKHYTDFESDPAGTRLVGQSGNAPVPTVRVTTHKRPPVSRDGYGFRVPKIDELIPYDTSRTMRLQSRGPDKHWERVDPRSMIGSMNGRINELALKASILYWLSGDEKYAKFAADILMQWAHGAYYQHPIDGSLRCGYFCVQTLGDASYAPLALTYDFVYSYLVKTGQDTSVVNKVLERLARTQVKHGFTHNNWFAAETPTLVWSALALDNSHTRKNLMKFYVDKDYEVHNGFGQWSIKTALRTFIDPHGHWEEAPNYHNYPIGRLYETGLAAENNHYPIFKRFPRLLKSASVIYKYSFPNGKAMAFGDCHNRTEQSPELLEIGRLMAQKYHYSNADTLNFMLSQMIKSGDYNRKNSGFLGLLCFDPINDQPDLSEINIKLPQTAALPYAHCYLQRNVQGDFKLMSYVQGATYNHNHANGMAMELYGDGYVMGADPGADISYDTQKHGAYYIQAGAHNTVVSAPQLPRTTPYSLGARQIGHITLNSMEPKPGTSGVSPFYSYSTTSYVDTTTRILTHQRRTMAVIRTTDYSGYYVDIFHSDNSLENDYVYHNIGRELNFYNSSGDFLTLKKANDFQQDFGRQGAGFEYFKNQKELTEYKGELKARFSLHGNSPESKQDDIFMNVFIPADTSQSFYKATAPRTHTAPAPFNEWPTPTLIIREKGKAWNHPFIAVYEPENLKTGSHIKQVEQLDVSSSDATNAALKITSEINDEQESDYIFDSSGNQIQLKKEGISFDGEFGIVSVRGDHMYSIYMGKGRQIMGKGYQLEAVNDSDISASFRKEDDQMIFSSDQPAFLTFPVKPETGNLTSNKIKISYQTENTAKKFINADVISTANSSIRIKCKLPAMRDGYIEVHLNH